MTELIFALTLLTAIGCGLVAGVFFAFSAFIMKALARVSPEHGITSMQSINIVVINPFFFAAFFGTAIGCAALLVYSLVVRGGPVATYQLVGSLLYLVGTIGVTMVFNVPRNNALGRICPKSDESARMWSQYVEGWTRWNHVRMIAALVSSAAFILAIDRMN